MAGSMADSLDSDKGEGKKLLDSGRIVNDTKITETGGACIGGFIISNFNRPFSQDALVDGGRRAFSVDSLVPGRKSSWGTQMKEGVNVPGLGKTAGGEGVQKQPNSNLDAWFRSIEVAEENQDGTQAANREFTESKKLPTFRPQTIPPTQQTSSFSIPTGAFRPPVLVPQPLPTRSEPSRASTHSQAPLTDPARSHGNQEFCSNEKLSDVTRTKNVEESAVEIRRRLDIERLHMQRYEEVRNATELSSLRRHTQYLNALLQNAQEDMKKADQENEHLRKQLKWAVENALSNQSVNLAWNQSVNFACPSYNAASSGKTGQGQAEGCRTKDQHPSFPLRRDDAMRRKDKDRNHGFVEKQGSGWKDLKRSTTSSEAKLQKRERSYVAGLLDRSAVALDGMSYFLSETADSNTFWEDDLWH